MVPNQSNHTEHSELVFFWIELFPTILIKNLPYIILLVEIGLVAEGVFVQKHMIRN